MNAASLVKNKLIASVAGQLLGYAAPEWVSIQRDLEAHGSYRQACLNLIASENITSPAVTRMLSNELSHRYGDYLGNDPTVRKYFGNRHVIRIEQTVVELAQDLFGASHVDLRPLSGHVAGEAALLALCQPGDTVLELNALAGGHRLAEKLKTSPLIQLKVAALPFDAKEFNVDVDQSREVIRSLKPRVVILGSSSFLFPHPVAAIREIVDTVPGTTLLYDASHVLGFIAAGRFQDPLREGAHAIVSSTHKTFAGPQGGLVMTNDAALADRIGKAIYPALVTNHHLHRLPALGVTCLEWKQHGPEHADAVFKNAQAFAAAAVEAGLTVVGNGRAYTESHTILITTPHWGEVNALCQRLEDAGLICGPVQIPEACGGQGLRFGVQELTRRGMSPNDAAPIVRLIADVLANRRTPKECEPEVKAIAARLNQCRFALS